MAFAWRVEDILDLRVVQFDPAWPVICVDEFPCMNQDFAHCTKHSVDIHFPEAEVLRVVLDNLITRTPALLYAVFTAEEDGRIVRKLEFHYTPKQASWLNMAKIKISVLDRQCLDRRLPEIALVRSEVAAWRQRRNQQRATVDWQFTNSARSKLEYLCPSLS